jgi:hypothetical protein
MGKPAIGALAFVMGSTVLETFASALHDDEWRVREDTAVTLWRIAPVVIGALRATRRAARALLARDVAGHARTRPFARCNEATVHKPI